MKIIVGITGASGSIIAYELVKELLSKGHFVHLIMTHMGEKIIGYELEKSADMLFSDFSSKNLCIEMIDDLFSSIASGSSDAKAMVVVPCSMGAIGKIANGISDNLLIRAADVMLKEKKLLILAFRETPLNSIHLENMLKITHAGGMIFPVCPAFYHKPTTIDEMVAMMVGKICSELKIDSNLTKNWKL